MWACNGRYSPQDSYTGHNQCTGYTGFFRQLEVIIKTMNKLYKFAIMSHFSLTSKLIALFNAVVDVTDKAKLF